MTLSFPTGEAHSLEEFVTMTFDHFGLNWRDHVVIDKALFRPAEISVMRGDPTKARQKTWLGGQDKNKAGYWANTASGTRITVQIWPYMMVELN